jgi:hypothetical protein
MGRHKPKGEPKGSPFGLLRCIEIFENPMHCEPMSLGDMGSAFCI